MGHTKMGPQWCKFCISQPIFSFDKLINEFFVLYWLRFAGLVTYRCLGDVTRDGTHFQDVVPPLPGRQVDRALEARAIPIAFNPL